MSIDNLRSSIDAIDRKIIILLNERCELARQIGQWKHEHNLPIYAPERERALLEKLTSLNQGPLPNDSLLAIYREIMSAAIRLEHPVCVSFLGPEGTFSHQAALEKFGHGVEMRSCLDIGDVFSEVETNRADYGIVPVENSTEGGVNATFDALIDSPLHIIGEYHLPIHHFLYGGGNSLKDVRCVYSHVQPLGQCRKYLHAHLKNATLIEVASTGRALELAAREGDSAAIAGARHDSGGGLNLLAENIEDNARNITRFLILGREEAAKGEQNKTSLCFSLHDRAGALYDALRPFRNHNISMSMIESRPLKNGTGNWEYCFFVDVMGHQNDPEIAAAFAELKSDCAFFKIFGSYPVAGPVKK